MLIADYFPVANKNASEVVPQIDGATSREKEEVAKQLKRLEEKPKGRGKYKTWTVAEKVEIGNYAIQYSVAAAVRDFSKKYPKLSKQTVSDFKNVCLYFFCRIMCMRACQCTIMFSIDICVHGANCFNFTVSFFTRLQNKISKESQTRQGKNEGAHHYCQVIYGEHYQHGGSPSFKRSTSNGCSYEQHRKGYHRS